MSTYSEGKDAEELENHLARIDRNRSVLSALVNALDYEMDAETTPASERAMVRLLKTHTQDLGDAAWKVHQMATALASEVAAMRAAERGREMQQMPAGPPASGLKVTL